MPDPVYMDHHATTPVDPRVLEAMLPWFSEQYGNPSSKTHLFGWKASEAVELARQQTADLVGAEARDVVFTSGATEAINLAISGLVNHRGTASQHVITCCTEHSAVLGSVAHVEKQGHSVSRLPVRPDGTLDLALLEAAIIPTTALISLMHANNEIGTIHPIMEIGALAASRGVLFHVDAAQSCGKVPVAVHSAQISLLSLSAHKFYGPKGAGALIIPRRSPRTRIGPLIFGGGHERGLRAGTLNVPGIVGMGRACQLAAEEMDAESARLAQLRDHLLTQLQRGIEGIQVNGSMENRLPNNLNVAFPGAAGELLINKLRNVAAVSSGSACDAATEKPSHVLAALGLSNELVHNSIRFGLGKSNTTAQVDYVAQETAKAVAELRAEAGYHL